MPNPQRTHQLNKITKTKVKLFFTKPTPSKIAAMLVVLVVMGSGIFLLVSNAAGFFASADPEKGTISGNAKVVTDSGASGGQAVEFTAPASIPQPSTPPTPPPTSSSCALPKYPTTNCAGVPAGVTLTTYNGDFSATTPGQVISGMRITGSLIVKAQDVVIKKSEITGKVVNDESSTKYRFTIEDSTIGQASGCSSFGNGAVGIANYTARRVHIRGFPDGFRIAGSNVIIEDSFVKLCSANSNDHSDGIQAYGASSGTNIHIRHNVIDQRAVTNGAATAPIFIPNDGDQQGNQNITVSVTDNVLAGGGYSMRIFGNLPFTATAVTGNKIVNNTWEYQPVDVACGSIGSWSDNATVNYDWNAGIILSQVKALNDCD